MNCSTWLSVLLNSFTFPHNIIFRSAVPSSNVVGKLHITADADCLLSASDGEVYGIGVGVCAGIWYVEAQNSLSFYMFPCRVHVLLFAALVRVILKSRMRFALFLKSFL